MNPFLVINTDSAMIPEGVKPLTSQGSALLNALLCLHYDPSNPPLADLLKSYHHLEGDWIILSPIYWQASHNDAFIVAAGKELQLDEHDAKSQFNRLATYLAAENRALYYHDAQTWLLQDNKEHPLKAKPVHQLIGKSFMPELDQLGNTLFWQKLITESQMLFASTSEQSAINGLWPWGGAQLTKKSTQAICADDTFFPIAKECSTHVMRYNSSLNIKEYDLLLISELSVLTHAHQEELKKLPIHWYWNNMAYTSSKSNWFTRLWRKLIHAH
jgi:hypothetical protein